MIRSFLIKTKRRGKEERERGKIPISLRVWKRVHSREKLIFGLRKWYAHGVLV
jgi:hypothetical protein